MSDEDRITKTTEDPPTARGDELVPGDTDVDVVPEGKHAETAADVAPLVTKEIG